MALQNPGYTGIAKSLHWLIVILLIGQYAVAWSMPHIGRNTKPDTLINLHFSLGVSILVVALVRLIYRLAHGAPVPAAGMPAWQTGLSHLVHRLLYLLLFVLPILGWMNASWRGFPVIMFGLELPRLLATREPGWGWTGDVHALLSTYLMLALIGLHVLAALYHHFIRHDSVLQRMLPIRS